MSDRYNVINKEEPRGQSVAENGIPCTTKYCVAQLNRLSQDNEKLEARLKLLSDFTEDFTQQINRSIMAENHILIEKLRATDKLLTDLYEGIDENYIETLGKNDELAIDRAEAQLQLIKKIIDRGGKNMIKKTICVDFDGVLNEYNGYEDGNLGEPLSGSHDFIRELRRKYNVVILTSRPKEQISGWLRNNGFPSMKVTNRKVPAVAYIDDRAIQFNGSYKKVISRLKNFKPYWAKEYYRVYNIVTDETIALFNDIYDATRVCNSYQSQDVRIQRIPGELE